jgi:hypothetical protein
MRGPHAWGFGAGCPARASSELVPAWDDAWQCLALPCPASCDPLVQASQPAAQFCSFLLDSFAFEELSCAFLDVISSLITVLASLDFEYLLSPALRRCTQDLIYFFLLVENRHTETIFHLEIMNPYI